MLRPTRCVRDTAEVGIQGTGGWRVREGGGRPFRDTADPLCGARDSGGRPLRVHAGDSAYAGDSAGDSACASMQVIRLFTPMKRRIVCL